MSTPNKTPAQSAKPFDAEKYKASQQAKEAKAAPSKAAAPSTAPPSTAGGADDPAKAIEQLQVKMKAVNTNNIARVANSHLTSSHAPLHALVSLKTGKPLDKFPAASGEIDRLSLNNVDAMLNALEADRSGNEAAKKERLRVQIGLPASPA